MGIFEIISAIVLIIACVFIVIVVLMQDTKTQMSKTISGNSSDNYFGKNSGRTKEAMLNKAMTIAAVVFFVLAVVVNVVNVYFGGFKGESADTSSGSTVVTAEVDPGTADASAAEQGTVDVSAAGIADNGAESAASEPAESGTAQAESTASTVEQ
ncbi:MAG: preprotein translocase subunit SecG [Oscillospiraceae bacterium]|nr:preprotein translocase subunit SecG [Oscillospiraceae bacterium]